MNNELGLVDNVSTDHIADAYNQAEYNNTRPAVEGMPTIQPQPYQPGTVGNKDYVMSGTVLSNTLYSFSDSGIHALSRASTNTTDQWEEDVRRQQQEMVRGRSRYNTPPSSSGFEPYIKVDDGKRASEEDLEKQRNKETAEQLTNMISRLQQEEKRIRLRLQHNLESQRSAKQRFEELDA